MRCSLTREVAGEECADASAERKHAPARIAEQLDHRIEIVLGDHADAGSQAVLVGRKRVLECRPARSRGRGQLVSGQWRAQALLQLLPERVLKLGVAPKAELGDESRHCGGADPGAFRKSREALEPGHGVEGEQHLRQSTFRSAQRSHPLANQFADQEFRHEMIVAVCTLQDQSDKSVDVRSRPLVLCAHQSGFVGR